MIAAMSNPPVKAAPRLPWPLLVVAGLVLVAYGFSLGRVLGPPLLAGSLIYLLLPYRRSHWVLRTLVVVTVAALLWLVARFGWIFLVLGISMFLAYLLDPAVDFLERGHIPRTLGILLLLVPVTATVVVALVLILPPLVGELGQIAKSLPQLLANVQETLRPLLTRLHLEELVSRYADQIPKVLEKTNEILAKTVTGVVQVTRLVATVVVSAIVVPVLTFFFLRDYDRLRSRGEDLIPRKFHEWFESTSKELDRLLGRWLRGVAIVALIVGTLTGAGLFALGIPYALALAALACVMNVVPYLGFWVSFIAAALVTLSAFGWGMLLKVTVLYLAISLIEGHVLQPRVVGGQVGLHPVVVLVALVVFANVFGLIGALVAVPLTIVITIFVRQLRALYLASDLYEENRES